MCGELFVNLCVCGGKFLLRVEMGVTKMWVDLVQAENNGTWNEYCWVKLRGWARYETESWLFAVTL